MLANPPISYFQHDNGFNDKFGDSDGTSMKPRWTSGGASEAASFTSQQREGVYFGPILQETYWFTASQSRADFQLVEPVNNIIEVIAYRVGIASITEDTAGEPFDPINDSWDISSGVVEGVDVPSSTPDCGAGLMLAVASDPAVLSDFTNPTNFQIIYACHAGGPQRCIQTIESNDDGESFETSADETLADTFADLRVLGTLSGGNITWQLYYREPGTSSWTEVSVNEYYLPTFGTQAIVGLTGYVYDVFSSAPVIAVCDEIVLVQGNRIDTPES